VQHIVFQKCVRAVTEQQERLQPLETELESAVKQWRLHPVVEAIQELRGVDLTGAVIFVAEVGGLTPSEYSSGDRRRQGRIAKTGNGHARRALVERAWAYRCPAKGSRYLQLRLEKTPAPVQAISGKAQVRLGKRDRQWSARAGSTR
jgi:transposase